MDQILHEIRDPIHVFIRLDDAERKVLNSLPVQRMRHIHQLALTYLVYPGASHKRFEHSLGVMELASRVFDVVTNREHVVGEVSKEMPELRKKRDKLYWKSVLRMAALCHDIGHLPFSHAAEADLLPEGWDHEKLTRKLLQEELAPFWKGMKIQTEDIVKVALGPEKAGIPLEKWSSWELILADIIVGTAFGVDRMDYLLRDSYHTGVAYGKFDHYRLIDTLRILPRNLEPKQEEAGDRYFALGTERGGVQSAEAMMLARYFMYSQVYFHRVRRIYDIHLKDFLQEWLPEHKFSTNLEKHLALTDNEVIAGLRKAETSPDCVGHVHARRIIRREHFKLLFDQEQIDVAIYPMACTNVYQALCQEFDSKYFRKDEYKETSRPVDFPVYFQNTETVSSSGLVSSVLNRVPVTNVGYVFADQSVHLKAREWLRDNLDKIIRLEPEGARDG